MLTIPERSEPILLPSNAAEETEPTENNKLAATTTIREEQSIPSDEELVQQDWGVRISAKTYKFA
jgi:hypothetical protein